MFMLMLDMTITIAAMASIKAELDASLSDLQWVIDAYTLPVAGLLLTAATLGDPLGRRRFYLVGSPSLRWRPRVRDRRSRADAHHCPGGPGCGAVLLFGVGSDRERLPG